METKELLNVFNSSCNRAKELRKECLQRIKDIQQQYEEPIEIEDKQQNDIFEKIIRNIISNYGSVQENGSYVIKFNHNHADRFAEFEIDDTEYTIGITTTKMKYVITEIILYKPIDESFSLKDLYIKVYRMWNNGNYSVINEYPLTFLKMHASDFINKLCKIVNEKQHTK